MSNPEASPAVTEGVIGSDPISGLAPSWFETSFEAMLVADRDGRVLAVNPACAELLGATGDELQSRSIFECLTPSAELRAQWRRLGHGTQELEAELPGRRGEDERRSVALRVTEAQDRVLVVIRDLSEPTGRDRRLSEELSDNLFHFAGDAILIHDLSGVIFDANPRATSMFAGSRAELQKRQILDFALGPARIVLRRAMEQLAELGSYRFEVDLVRSTGESFVATVASSLLSLDGRSVVQSHLQDASRYRDAERLLRQAYFNDPLTGLPNRTWLEDRLTTAIDRAGRRSEEGFILLLLGLDRFQTVNDSLGRRVGDYLLVEVASRLSEAIGDTDAVARVGSDEFAVLMPKVTSLIQAREAAVMLQRAVAEPLAVENRRLIVTTSVGIVRCQDTYSHAEECLRDAGAALVEAKAGGSQQQKIFDRSLFNRAVRRLDLEQDLFRAVQDDQLRLHFQPIVELGTGKICELECLVRWQHPTRGLVSPMEFLPLAEETGLITDLDAWVLRTAAQTMRRFRKQLGRHSPRSLAVNASSRGFCQLEMVSLVDEVLRENGLSSRSLKIEVTESAMIGEIAVAAEVLSRLQERGVEVCLDDFGTGYASLGYLHRFPVTTLKIDRSFVSGPSKGSRIIEAVVLLGHNLGMAITAEGIETMSDLARVRDLGCEKGQGYLFSKPLEEAAVVELLKRDPTW